MALACTALLALAYAPGLQLPHRLSGSQGPSTRPLHAARVAMVTEYGPEVHPEQLAAFGAVAVMTAVGYVIWDKVLVPQKRLELSRSKRSGEMKELLDQIETSPSERPLEAWFFTDWLEARNGTQQKKAAVPFLPKTKFNSGDNPVIGAVAAVMLTGVLSSAVKEVVRFALGQHGA
jgi:hypothetical protein